MSRDLRIGTTPDGAVGFVESRVPEVAVSSERRTTMADIAGVAAVASIVGLATEVATRLRGIGLGRSDVILAAVIVLGVATAICLVILAAREDSGVAALVRRTTEVWRDPPGGWVAVSVGAIVAIPLYMLFTGILFADADSARIVAASRYLLDGHSAFDYFTRTQQASLPPLVNGLAVTLGGLPAVKLLPLLAAQLVAGVTSYVTYQITRSLWGASAAALSLLCLAAFNERAVKVPMYGPMLALGYLGGWLAYRAVAAPDATWRCSAAAGACIVLAAEAHGVGQLFLAVPLLVTIFAPNVRSAARAVAVTYGLTLLFLLPRIVVNLWVGGLTAVTSPRADYWITEGYVVEIQRKLFFYDGIDEPRAEFLSRLPRRFVELLGPHGWVVVAIAVVGALVVARGRARWFTLAVVAFLTLALTVKRIPSFSRYYAPTWPGLGVLVGVTVAALARRRRVGVVGATGLTAVLALVAIVTLRDSTNRFEMARQATQAGAYPELASSVVDDEGVIGARATQAFTSTRADVTTWGPQFLTEEEYVTYLSWPSNAEVLHLLERHDIGWVFIHANGNLEWVYNDVWMIPAHGLQSLHAYSIGDNPDFCLWREVDGHRLFRVGGCEP